MNTPPIKLSDAGKPKNKAPVLVDGLGDPLAMPKAQENPTAVSQQDFQNFFETASIPALAVMKMLTDIQQGAGAAIQVVANIRDSLLLEARQAILSKRQEASETPQQDPGAADKTDAPAPLKFPDNTPAKS